MRAALEQHEYLNGGCLCRNFKLPIYGKAELDEFRAKGDWLRDIRWHYWLEHVLALLASSEGPARQCSHRKQMDKTSGHWMQCGLDEGHSGDHDYCWLRTEPAPTFEEPLRERITQLEKALDSAIGWIGYGEDCDPYYFSHDQAPEFEKEFAEIKAVRAGAEKLAGE